MEREELKRSIVDGILGLTDTQAEYVLNKLVELLREDREEVEIKPAS